MSAARAERLIRYFRQVEALDQQAIPYVSSEELAACVDATPAQVRKDLTLHASLGVPGRGYPVHVLRERLREQLHKQRPRLIGIVGVGHLGLALIRHPDFARHGFHIVAGFDTDPSKVGRSIDGVYIYDISQIPRVCPLLKIEIGVLTVPAKEAQGAFDRLVQAGVSAVLNFAPVRLSTPQDVVVASVDLSIELEKLCCRMEGLIS